MNKKVISSVMAFTMIFAGGAVLPEGAVRELGTLSASADEDFVFGPFNYHFLSDGTIAINGYCGEDSDTVTEIEVPEDFWIDDNGRKVTEVSEYAFADIPNLKRVILPESMVTIGEHAIGYKRNGSSFTKISGFKILGYKGTVAESYASENGIAFEQAIYESKDYMYRLTDDGTITLVNYIGSAKAVTIPEKIDGKKVTEIYNWCFGAQDITSVTMGSNIRRIGNGSFLECKKLKTITLPDSITYIDDYAFNGAGLTTIGMPSGLTYLGTGAFLDCSALKSIDIPDKITTIKEVTFWGCSKLATVKMPSKLKVIENNAFLSCPKLKSVSLPKTVTELGYHSIGVDFIDGDTEREGFNAWEWDNHKINDGFVLSYYKDDQAVKDYVEQYGMDYQLIDGTSVKNCSITLKTTSYTYSGKAKKPGVTVKNGKTTLKKGKDYTVTYKNNTKVGKSTVTIKGKGDYTGTVTKTFKINPKKTTVSKVTSPKAKQLKVTYKKVSGVTGYQVTYSTSSKFTDKTTKTTTVKGVSKLSKTVKSLKSGKTYYVKVRSYKTVDGKKYYSDYTKVKKIKVK